MQHNKSEDPDEMQHNAAFRQLHFVRVNTICKGNKIFRQNNTIFFNNNLTPADMYDGLSQVYCIKPGGRIY